jgi:multiple antibiotic resistance protein
MMIDIFQLVILFFVIYDPLASLAVFLSATKRMHTKERLRVGLYAILVAGTLSYLVLFLGAELLRLFSTTLDEFRIAGGIILSILGVHMALGKGITDGHFKERSGKAIASIIGTPLLTGPAAITAILISTADYGRVITGIALTIVLLFTCILFLVAGKVRRFFGSIQVITTILGLITLAWGVKFIIIGLQNIFLV